MNPEFEVRKSQLDTDPIPNSWVGKKIECLREKLFESRLDPGFLLGISQAVKDVKERRANLTAKELLLENAYTAAYSSWSLAQDEELHFPFGEYSSSRTSYSFEVNLYIQSKGLRHPNILSCLQSNRFAFAVGESKSDESWRAQHDQEGVNFEALGSIDKAENEDLFLVGLSSDARRIQEYTLIDSDYLDSLDEIDFAILGMAADDLNRHSGYAIFKGYPPKYMPEDMTL